MKTLHHKFVEAIPDIIEEGVIYVTLQYCTAIHKCVCGCGNEVVTPISPTDWKLTFDGESISLSPSIGNWNFECRSHYWVTNNKITHSRSWSREEIDYGRKKDKKKKKMFFEKKIKGDEGKTKYNKD